MEILTVLLALAFLYGIYLFFTERAKIKQIEVQRRQREVQEREADQLRLLRIAEEQKRQRKRQEEANRQKRIQATLREEEKIRQKQASQETRLRATKALEEQARQEQKAKLQQEKAEQERQEKILKQQKFEQEQQAAEKRQRALQEVQRQQAQQERLVEEGRIALIKRQQKEAQLSFCETDTTYYTDLIRLYDRNPANFKFTTVRSLSKDCGVWHELERGLKQLRTYEQLSQYTFSLGLMHQAKLQQAYHSVFSNNHLPLTDHQVEIIDYGCGQGIGTICLIDYLKENTRYNCVITEVKLIEPSIIALKRAVLNIRYSLKSFNQLENVFAINKELDDITQQDIDTQDTAVKIHIFSNIIDVEGFDLYQLYHKIQATQKGINIFVCTSPNIKESLNQRLDRFQRYFVSQHTFIAIDNRESDIPNPRNPDKPYQRYERIFRVHLGETATVNNPVILTHLEDDDIPF